MIDETMMCPECGAQVPVEPAFSWCDECGWNADQDAPRAHGKAADEKRRRRAEHGALAMFEVMTGPGGAKASWATRIIGAYALALSVVVTGLSAIVLCVLWLGAAWPRPLGVVLASIGLLLALSFRPRLGRVGRKAITITRGDAPALYELLDTVSEALQIGRIHIVVIDAAFNATSSHVGLRRRRVLTLGVPLWSVLGSRARLALLGHELAHEANRDVRRTFLLAVAEATLADWFDMLQPGNMPLGRYGSPAPFVSGGQALATGVQRTLARAVRAVWELEQRLTFSSHQLAEYRADELAAVVAGGAAVTEVLETLLCASEVRRYLHEALSRDSVDPLGAARARLTSISEREVRRLRLVSRSRLTGADTSHPPTALRLDAIESRTHPPGQVDVSRIDFRAIDAQLLTAFAQVEDALGRRYR